LATVAIPKSKLRFENLFFSGMAVVIFVSVFVGFAPSYYLASVFKAPPLNLLIHFHGTLVATENLANNYPSTPSEQANSRAFYAVALADMLMFSTLIYFAFRNRFNPAAHKRLILIATLAILDAAFDRWKVPVPWWGYRVSPLFCTYPLLLLLMGYDRWSTGKIQPVTLSASLFLVVVQYGRILLGHTVVWQRFAAWVYAHSSIFHRLSACFLLRYPTR